MGKALAYPLLVVEDSNEDFEVIQWALHRLAITIPVYRCKDGDEVMDYLQHRGQYSDPVKAPRPALILLDLGLTLTDGQEVLERIKRDEALRMIPVIIWTTSSDPRDVEICFKQGANSYILKPMTMEKLLETIELLNQYWFGVAVLPDTAGM